MVGSLTCLRNSLRSFFFCSSWRAYRKLNFQNSTFHTFIFFSVRELTEFNKSCNLIGSGSGWNFPIRPALGRWNQHLLKSVSSLSGNLCSYVSKNLTVLYVYVLQYQLQVTKQLGGQSDKQKVWLKTLNNYFLSWSRFKTISSAYLRSFVFFLLCGGQNLWFSLIQQFFSPTFNFFTASFFPPLLTEFKKKKEMGGK